MSLISKGATYWDNIHCFEDMMNLGFLVIEDENPSLEGDSDDDENQGDTLVSYSKMGH